MLYIGKKNSERQISTQLTVLKHQNTKTSLYKLSEDNWAFTLFEFFGSVRKRLQFTVYNDHPVLSHIILHCIILMQEDDHMQNWVTACHGRWQLYDHNMQCTATLRISEKNIWYQNVKKRKTAVLRSQWPATFRFSEKKCRQYSKI